MFDPLNTVTSKGFRVAWLGDLDGRIIILDDERLVIADAALSRSVVADCLTAEPDTSGRVA